MKRYSELTEEQQQKATDKALTDLLEAVVSGAVRFNDDQNGDNLQASIDAALEKANKQQVPWFAHEFVLEATYDDGHLLAVDCPLTIGEVLRGMATCDAEDGLYTEPTDPPVVHGIAC